MSGLYNSFPFTIFQWSQDFFDTDVSRPSSVSFDMGIFGVWTIDDSWYPYDLVRAFLLTIILVGLAAYLIGEIL